MTTKPQIELRGIKYTAWASEETFCYQATLYVDGEKWGTVGNDGHGGCDHFHGAAGRSYDDIRDLDARIAATYPATVYSDMTIPASLEGICAGLVGDWLMERDFKRAMKCKVLFVKRDTKGLFEFKVKKPHTHASTLAAVKAKYPQYIFLADLPPAEALERFTRGS